MRSVIASAPGKIILHGEHAVVHGTTAIAACLGLRTCVQLLAGADVTDPSKLSIGFPDVDSTDCYWMLEDLDTLRQDLNLDSPGSGPAPPNETQATTLREFVATHTHGRPGKGETVVVALTSLLYLYLCLCPRDNGVPPAHVEVRSQLPIGAGLGSSAAYSVALVAALLAAWGLVQSNTENSHSDGQVYNHIWADKESPLINTWGFVAEKIIHGNPSGIDNSVACFGGAMRFKKGQMTPIRMPELRICLTNTKVPRSTKALVAEVGRRKTVVPSVINPMLDAVQGISDEVLSMFDLMNSSCSEETRSECLQKMELLVDINQSILNGLGVGHPSLDKMCSATSKYGLHSKLTGAGGGGCGITLLRDDTSPATIASMFSDLHSLGYEVWETAVGGPGVAQHSNLPTWWARAKFT